MYRKKMKASKDRRKFSRTADMTHKKNYASPKRGGIRL